MRKTIATLLSVSATLLVVILIALLTTRGGSTPAANVSTEEQEEYATLEMLAIAEKLPTEFEKRMWIMATKLVKDGYTNNDKPLEITAREINVATLGYHMLSPPDSVLFPVRWKLVRSDDITEKHHRVG